MKEFDFDQFNKFCNNIKTKIECVIGNMVFEQEANQTIHIFEDDLWKEIKLLPNYNNHEVRISCLGISNNDRMVSGSVLVRMVGFDGVRKIDFWSDSLYAVVE